ncbi:hypothetical protein VSS74_05720 [Conexibacter stalactiti]|uniref:Uncharacterized protein n=1 Tax=Conexibacter stalactiti TaxID=1940611 RepID=A0ABU4HKH5_9ACTN|nr:hypothetical protein [Conexibacter stalactiti]MDW5593821.1 hypothetical protein [Conexibacter stalactiti]MEC5034463.1 hypothetical protein [Conexibacter stalactiti]
MSGAKPPAPRASVDPTPLRLLEPQATDVNSDGERFVVVSFDFDFDSGRPADVYDTFTGRRTSLPAGCGLTGIVEQTTTLTAGRALLLCDEPSQYVVYDLASESVLAALPLVVEVDGTRYDDPRYETLGRRWVRASVGCPGFVSCATLYYDFTTGEARVLRYAEHRELRSRREFYDLDAPGLPLRRVCRGSIAYDEYVRHYRPPWYVGGGGLRRCRDGRLLVAFSKLDHVTADLTAVGLAWGTTVQNLSRRPSPFVNYYAPARRRLWRWKLPRRGERAAYGTAVVTRCELFALTSLSFEERGGEPTAFRVHRARMPGPRDARCQR